MREKRSESNHHKCFEQATRELIILHKSYQFSSSRTVDNAFFKLETWALFVSGSKVCMTVGLMVHLNVPWLNCFGNLSIVQPLKYTLAVQA